VPVGLRAYAAYGLGLLGAEIDDMPVRSRIVADLVQLLDEELDTNELQVAAMVALGLVPLEMDAEAVVCVCGGCKVSGPETNFQSQVTYLMRYFTADREFDPTVRAHTATTLGRLIAAAAEVAPEELLPPLDEIKGATAEFLIGALQKYARQPLVVQQSAVLALGLIGDADDQEVDQWIRHELKRAAGHSGDPLAKRFALMALAEVGAREGQGDQPWAGTQEVRGQLLQVLSRGKKSVKPWAGLALGVLGHELALASQPLDPSVDKALQRMTKLAKNADDLGAYALAAGLRRDRSAAPQLLSKLEKTKHDDARAYAAMGLGLMGAREAVEPLQAILADSEGSVRNRAGLALGMLGDVSVVERLIAELQDPDTTTEEKAALAQALGFIGDQRAVDALVRLAHDKETEGMMSVARDRAVLALGLLADAGTAAWRVRLAHGANYRAETESLTNAERTGVLDLH
jgi:HEAT repeat protein